MDGSNISNQPRKKEAMFLEFCQGGDRVGAKKGKVCVNPGKDLAPLRSNVMRKVRMRELKEKGN